MAIFAASPPPAGAWGQRLARPPGARAALGGPNLGPIQRAFWVAPWGRAGAAGTERDPFCGPAAARDAARPLLAHMAGDVCIVLRGGRYELESTFALSAADSGQNGHRVRYVAAPSEVPVLCGGRPIDPLAWTPVAGRPWLRRAPLPAGVATTRQLYVDGVRARRVRAAPPASSTFVQTSEGYSFSTFSNPLAGWRNPRAIEFVYNLSWMQYRLPVGELSLSTITMADAGGMPWSAAKTMSAQTFAPVHLDAAGPPDYVEHAYELLSAATVGAFWVDASGSPSQIYYVPRPGEDLAHAQCTVPALEQLLSVSADPTAPLHDVSLEGLSFAEAGWLGPNSTGHAEFFGNLYVASPADATPPYKFWFTKTPAALAVRGAQRLAVVGCTMERLGASALSLDGGSTDGIVQDCIVRDVSANGIDISAPQDAHSATPCARLRVSGCTISDVCTEYQGGAAILCWQTVGTTIEHNAISNLPYDAIIMGAGGSGPGALIALPMVRRSEIVRANHIAQVMQVLVDGGALYTNADADGLLWQGNVIEGVRAYTPGGLLYMDDLSAHVLWRNNVLLTAGGPSPLNFNNNTGPTSVRLNFSDAARTTGNAGSGPPHLALNRLIGPDAPAPASIVGAAGPAHPPAAACSAPLGLALVSADPPNSTLTLSWTAPAAGTATFYEVWVDDVVAGTTTALRFTFADLGPGHTFVFSVRAADAGGGSSVPSAPLVYVAPPDTVARWSYGTGWE